MIFIVACTEPGSVLPEAVVEEAKATHQLGSGPIWIVDIDCLSSELVDMIWPDDEEDESPAGLGLVVNLDTYGGYAPKDFWTWAKGRKK